jgi:DNA-dependent RNA polymerase auxiliary subunit epsilon
VTLGRSLRSTALYSAAALGCRRSAQFEFMTNTQSNSNAPTEWLVVHHELKNESRRLIIQHLIEPKFMAEVTEKKGYEVEFLNKVSDEVLRLPRSQMIHWRNKTIAQFESEVEKQFKNAGRKA